MEDSHTHILALPDDPSAAFFAVYDGHGGESLDHPYAYVPAVLVFRPRTRGRDSTEGLRTKALLNIFFLLPADVYLLLATLIVTRICH